MSASHPARRRPFPRPRTAAPHVRPPPPLAVAALGVVFLAGALVASAPRTALADTASTRTPPALAPSPAAAPTGAERIDVNVADATELSAGLPGIGAVKAAALVAHREAHGPFASPDALVAVRGIGPKTLERLRPLLSVGAARDRRHREAERRTREALARIVARARAGGREPARGTHARD